MLLRCELALSVLGSGRKMAFYRRKMGDLFVSEQAPLARGTETQSERRLVVITGLSGAGKTNALRAFEDAGYYCIDNLPPTMIPDVLALAPAEEEGTWTLSEARAVGSPKLSLSRPTTGRW